MTRMRRKCCKKDSERRRGRRRWHRDGIERHACHSEQRRTATSLRDYTGRALQAVGAYRPRAIRQRARIRTHRCRTSSRRQRQRATLCRPSRSSFYALQCLASSCRHRRQLLSCSSSASFHSNCRRDSADGLWRQMIESFGVGAGDENSEAAVGFWAVRSFTLVRFTGTHSSAFRASSGAQCLLGRPTRNTNESKTDRFSSCLNSSHRCSGSAWRKSTAGESCSSRRFSEPPSRSLSSARARTCLSRSQFDAHKASSMVLRSVPFGHSNSLTSERSGAVGVARGAVQSIADPTNEARAFTYIGLCWGRFSFFQVLVRQRQCTDSVSRRPGRYRWQHHWRRRRNTGM